MGGGAYTNMKEKGIYAVAVTLALANVFVAKIHRHHKPVRGHKFSIGAADVRGRLLGVAIVGRPVARLRDDGLTLEVTRLCTLPYGNNTCSFLYGRAARVARELGYKRIGTYILDRETGVSLRAAGWINMGGGRGGMSWTGRPGRRVDHDGQTKTLYQLEFPGCPGWVEVPTPT